MTEELRKNDVQMILLLNIKSYAAGMNPWICNDQQQMDGEIQADKQEFTVFQG